MRSPRQAERDSSQQIESNSSSNTILPQDCVLIIGGGPVGLSLATVLAFYGVKSIVLERNETTTKWPKMDLTNVRSMELFRKLGLAQQLRSQGVASHIPCPVLISSGLSKEKPITQWRHPSVDQYRMQIASTNDGTMPLEPYQRISQAVFEKWLKAVGDANPLIDFRFGQEVESVEQTPGGVRVVVGNMKDGRYHTYFSRYVAGCDGGSSRVRRSLEIPLDGGPTPGYMLLVHFKSRDLTRLHKQGQFWHIFFIGEAGFKGAIISQNEIDTWTTHLVMPLEVHPETVGSEEAVSTVLGGLYDQYPIKIDEILVRSTYRPYIAVARSYSGLNGHVYLAGDSAHQNIPTGGYGMNMGIADAFNLGWKLSTVINGHSRKSLLSSYEEERRPVALTSIERSGAHMGVHTNVANILGKEAHAIDEDTPKAKQLREAVDEHYQKNDGENTDLGIEMGYCYKSKIICADGSKEPSFDPSRYLPTTYPGSRAPHVFLRDKSAIFDHYGKYYTLVEFTDDTERGAALILRAAREEWVPVEHVVLKDEDHAQKIWERRLVLVRPDGHVAWRGDAIQTLEDARHVITTTSGGFATTSGGFATTESTSTLKGTAGNGESAHVPHAFSSTVGVSTQIAEYQLERMSDFQA